MRNTRWTVRTLRLRLKELGCVFVRCNRSSHEIWALPTGESLPPIVIHGKGDVFPKDLKRFLKERGINLEES